MNTKALLGVSLLCSSVFSATDTQIINYFKSQIPVPTIQIEVTSRVNIDNVEGGLEYVTLNISDGQRAQELSVFTKDNLIFPDVININDGGSIKEKLDRDKLIKNLSKIYKEEDPKNILMVGNDSKKETLVVFTDPECPFCNKEVQKIEQRLETYNLKLIFTPVHDRSSLEKSVLILKQASNLKDTKEQVKIIQKYFNGDVDAKVSDEEVQNIQNLISKYFSAGIKGVPFIVNEKDLLN
jgi:thiol:disulfide interchange protein DsbC